MVSWARFVPGPEATPAYQMKAILSDIHGNLEALRAVLDDIARHSVEVVYCLGDLVGYGPNPRECVDLAMRWQVVLLGDFDQGVMNVPPDFGPTALSADRSIRWSQGRLDAPVPGRQAAERRWAFLKGLAPRHEEGDFLFVHGSARNPLHEYVFPEDVHNRKKMTSIFASVGRHCFQGHTHIPGVFTEQAPGDIHSFACPEEIDFVHRLDGRKTLCNVGSVGQPRDGDWRACYVLLDRDIVRFRRVGYDIERTIRKVHDIDDTG
jgi:diadenosine tetraphosphatase ApaH/serine/threonine PP2A family protein phosphatase